MPHVADWSGDLMSIETIVGIAIPSSVMVIAIGTLLFKAGGWYSHVNADLSTLTQLMEEIREDIKMILLRLPAPAVEGESPLRLTELDKQSTPGR